MEVMNPDEEQDDLAETGATREALVQRSVSTYQVVRSLSTLLLKAQVTVDCNFAKIADYLAQLGRYIQGLQAHQDGHSLRYTEAIGQLFRFFSREAVKAVRREPEERAMTQISTNTRDVILTYVETVAAIASEEKASPANKEYLAGLVELVEAAGVAAHGHIAVLLLIAHSRRSLKVGSQMELEGVVVQFAQSLLASCLESTKQLSPIQNLLLCLAGIPLSPETLEMLERQLGLVDDSLVEEAAAARLWLSQKRFFGAFAEICQMRFLVLYALNTWLQTDKAVVHRIEALSRHYQQPAVAEQFLTVYLTLGAMHNEVAYYRSQKLHRNEPEAKAAKEAAKRLASRVTSVQQTLNSILQHEIHCSIVQKILAFDGSEVLGLQANALEQLLEKTPDFYFEISPERQRHMVKLFEPLVEQALEFLADKQAQKQAQSDAAHQTYVSALFALLSKTACQGLSASARQQAIKTSLKYLSKQDKLPLPLVSQLLISETHQFEVYQAEILEHLPDHVDQLISASTRAHQARKDQEFFNESLSRAVLKAILTVFTLFAKFLNS